MSSSVVKVLADEGPLLISRNVSAIAARMLAISRVDQILNIADYTARGVLTALAVRGLTI